MHGQLLLFVVPKRKYQAPESHFAEISLQNFAAYSAVSPCIVLLVLLLTVKSAQQPKHCFPGTTYLCYSLVCVFKYSLFKFASSEITLLFEGCFCFHLLAVFLRSVQWASLNVSESLLIVRKWDSIRTLASRQQPSATARKLSLWEQGLGQTYFYISEVRIRGTWLQFVSSNSRCCGFLSQVFNCWMICLLHTKFKGFPGKRTRSQMTWMLNFTFSCNKS